MSSLGVVENDDVDDDIMFDRRIEAVSFNSNCENNNLTYFHIFDLKKHQVLYLFALLNHQL